VKALAAQTAKATDAIGTEPVNAIKEIGGTIGRISEIASTIAAAVEQQSATTQEIARNVHGASKGTAQVASNIGDVLKGEVEAFLRSVRAA
jgi:methyl-accepting chemotaxis protein